MPSYEPVVKNGASGAIFYISLPSMATSGTLQTNPTLAAADINISKDGGALAALTTTPVVTPAGSKLVKVTLSQAETNADSVAIVFADVTVPKEWCDTFLAFNTVAQNFDTLATAASQAAIQTDTDDIQARLPAALVGGRMSSQVGAMATDVLDASALAASAVTEIQTGLATATALATVQADTDDIQARLPAALVSGRMDSSVGAMATDVVNANALAADAVTEINAGMATAAAVAAVQADTDDIQTRLPAALVAGRMSSQVGAIGADVITAAAIALDADTEIANAVWTNATRTLTSASGPDAVTIADAVWDEVLSGHLTAGTTGKALSDGAAPVVSDPWSISVPGAYAAGTAGNILGNRLDVAVSTRASAAALATVQSDTDDIQTRLPAALVAGRMDVSVGAMATDVLTAAALATSAVTEINTGIATAASVAALQSDTDDIQSRLPGALVGGRIDASVGSIGAGAITGASFAAGAFDNVWTVTARTLTSGANIVLAKGTGVTGFVDIDAPGVRAAVGMASANLDTQLAAIKTDTTTISGKLPALVGGRVDASVGAMGANTLTAAALATDAVVEIVDGLLDRDMALGTDSGSASVRTVRQALRPLRNKWTIVSGTYQVTKEDDLTVSWQSTMTGTAGVNPVTGSDPQ